MNAEVFWSVIAALALWKICENQAVQNAFRRYNAFHRYDAITIPFVFGMLWFSHKDWLPLWLRLCLLITALVIVVLAWIVFPLRRWIAGRRLAEPPPHDK